MTQPRMVGHRYELGELIGYGGMAEVHLGRDVRLGRDVAIKVLRADLARDPAFLNRFRREAQSAAGLNHPAIVSVYDTGEDVTGTGTDSVPMPYIVMEFVSGRTLRDILRAEGPLPAAQAMQIMSEVCSALDYSHRNGIIHRDIKPANIMIADGGAVKVMDFGIARAVADNSATVTQTAAVIGTAQYLSPEQARGEQVDARSDVYAAGCVLYELTTGMPPFKGDSPVAIAYQHVRENPSLPSVARAGVPRVVDSIVMKAMAKNPANRYQTAGEMRADLQRAVADRPVEAEAVMSDDERTQIIGRAAPRPPVVPLSGDVYDDGSGERRSALVWLAVVVALLLVIGAAAYAIVSLNKNDAPKTALVPSLIGTDSDAASNALTSLGFKVGAVTQSAGPCGLPDAPVTVKEGQVCTQQVAAGQSAQIGSTISFTTYASGTVQMPQVVGSLLPAALAALHTSQLTAQPTVTLVNTFSAPANTVIAQNPPAYAMVPPGQAITLQVSTGKQALPSVVGMKYEDAKAELNQKGWLSVADPVYTPTLDPKQNGLVASQDPTANAAAPASQVITLTVYQYTPPTTPASSTCPTTPTGTNQPTTSFAPGGVPGAPGVPLAPGKKTTPAPPGSGTGTPSGTPTC